MVHFSPWLQWLIVGTTRPGRDGTCAKSSTQTLEFRRDASEAHVPRGWQPTACSRRRKAGSSMLATTRSCGPIRRACADVHRCCDVGSWASCKQTLWMASRLAQEDHIDYRLSAGTLESRPSRQAGRQTGRSWYTSRFVLQNKTKYYASSHSTR